MSGIDVKADFSGLEKFIKDLKKPMWVDIGILGNNTNSSTGTKVTEYMAKHEFGVISTGLPERSFIRLGLQMRRAYIMGVAEKKYAENPLDIKAVFTAIGIAGENAIKECFKTSGFGTWPKLSEDYKVRPSGQAVDESSKPLLDTSSGVNSIISKVKGD